MRKAQKVLGVMMALIMVMGMSTSVCASEPIEGAGDTPVLFAEGLYEGEELEVVAETLGCDMVTEDGYVLQSISVFLVVDDNETEVFADQPTPMAIGDYVDGVTKAASNIYFQDSPITSDWYDGQLTKLTLTFSETVSAKYSCSASVSADVISAGVAFDVTESVTKSTTWERPAISSTQKINIKVYGIYDKYTFTARNIWGNVKGDGTAYKPMGLYVAQTTYVK